VHYSRSDFWTVNEIKYALLAPLPQDLLLAPASTAYMEVERVFSLCGELADERPEEKNFFLKMDMIYDDIMDDES